MIDATRVIGHSAAKWSKHQPDEGILWSNKLSRGVQGASKAYIAFHPDSYSLIYIHQLLRQEDKKVVWQVGKNKWQNHITEIKTFENIEEAKQFVRESLND